VKLSRQEEKTTTTTTKNINTSIEGRKEGEEIKTKQNSFFLF